MPHLGLTGLEYALEGLLPTTNLSDGKLENKYYGNSQIDEIAGKNEEGKDQSCIQKYLRSEAVLLRLIKVLASTA